MRPFTKMPDFPKLLPGTELKRGAVDLPLPDSGAWNVTGPLELGPGDALPAVPAAGGAEWTRRKAIHGFVDFNHLYRPETRGVGTHWSGRAAAARCVLKTSRPTEATLRLAWDDRLAVQVNDQPPIDLGDHTAFRAQTVKVPLGEGANRVTLMLTNTHGTNHGGWTFAFRATAADGEVLLPQAE